MQNLKDYWRRVHDMESSLPEYLFLVGDGDPVECSSATAARLLVAGNHRRAIDAEVEQYRERERQGLEAARAADLLRQGRAVVTVPAGKKSAGKK